MDKEWAAGWWEVPGGGVRAGEDSLDAVIREIKEETGVDVTEAEGGYAFSYKRVNPEEKNNYFVDIYKFILDFDESDVKTQEEEVSGFAIADIKEIKRPDKDAQLVAENIALQLENRISFRRAMKSCMSRTMKSGALGIKTAVSGRLGGADMARTEFYSEGTIPLQTLRADIDYGFAEADTTYGKVGVKVWIYKGEVLPTKATKEGSDK